MAAPATQTPAMQPFDIRSFLRHGLISAVFCCAIALALTVSGQGAWDVQLAYSLGIGLVTWLVIDLGRAALIHFTHQAWPHGWRGVLLIAAGIATGYVVGSAIGNAYSGGPATLPHGPLPGLAITIAAGAGISFFFYSQGQARHLQARMAQAQRDAAEARLKLLEAQLEPHMLFNTLANLRVLVATDAPRAQAMLDHLIAYLRATLGASRATQHPLADEFERLRDYLELMAVRMGPRLAYQLDLPEALRAVAVPPLLLQPLHPPRAGAPAGRWPHHRARWHPARRWRAAAGAGSAGYGRGPGRAKPRQRHARQPLRLGPGARASGHVARQRFHS